jgi:hypothetical protein
MKTYTTFEVLLLLTNGERTTDTVNAENADKAGLLAYKRNPKAIHILNSKVVNTFSVKARVS